MGPAVFDWSGQHSSGAYGRRAHSKKTTGGSSRDLRADGAAASCDGSGAGMTKGLAIVGYGKMGKLIESLAPEYGFEVRAKFSGGSNPGGSGLSHETLRGIDVAMEFTTPVAAPVNIQRLAVLGVDSVVGTTGWFEQLP